MALTLATLTFTACGGSTHGDDDDDDGGQAGEATRGGSGGSGASGGTSAGGAGGTSATGGVGGTSATGGAGGTSATGGAGGTPATGGAGGTSATGGAGGTTGGAGGTSATGGSGVSAAGGTGGVDTPDLPRLRRSGKNIVDTSDVVTPLRGISFGNDVWNEPNVPLTTHHTGADYERLASFGANAARFYLNYQLFEDDASPGSYKQAGFDYLDQNIAWARAHGIYLVLNMHVPQGGFQSNGDGNALWTDVANQDRLVALWRAIAEHCKSDFTVAGYDFLNEPRPTTARSQWVDLATRLATTVREVDPDHMLFIERTNSVGDDWSFDESMNLFTIPDDNVVYEFHFYDPFDYTTQLASWIPTGEGGKYPDPERISSTNLTWYLWSYDPAPPPYAPPGDSDWMPYESEPYVISDPEIEVLGIALISELNSGTILFDDVFMDEYDPEGTLVARVFEEDLETLDGWSFWKAGELGAASVGSEAHTGSASLLIANTDHDANLTSSFRYPARQGYSYVVGGFMKGQAIAEDSRPDPRGDWTQVSRALIRLDYYSADGPVVAREKALLENSIDRYVSWGESQGVPLFVGEFGLIHACFEDDRGGTNWVADMLEVLDARSLNFSYHVYHEAAFGIFTSQASTLPDPSMANQPLIDTLTAGLAH